MKQVIIYILLIYLYFFLYIQNINEKVRIYNENILNERRLKRNERVRSFRKNKKFNELKDKNIEYFNKKQEAKIKRQKKNVFKLLLS